MLEVIDDAVITPRRGARYTRANSITIKNWTLEHERSLHLLDAYLFDFQHIDGKCSTLVVVWAVKFLASLLKQAERLDCRADLRPLLLEAMSVLPPPRSVPPDDKLRNRTCLVVVGWTPSAEQSAKCLQQWAAQELHLPMSLNRIASWAVLTLADIIRQAWIEGQPAPLPTVETARWQGYRELVNPVKSPPKRRRRKTKKEKKNGN